MTAQPDPRAAYVAAVDAYFATLAAGSVTRAEIQARFDAVVQQAMTQVTADLAAAVEPITVAYNALAAAAKAAGVQFPGDVPRPFSAAFVADDFLSRTVERRSSRINFLLQKKVAK